MKKIIVIINGPASSGKDTVVTMLGDLIGHYCVTNYSSVEPIKHLAREIGWDSSKKEINDRNFLAALKKLTTEYNDYPYREMKKVVRDFYKTFTLISAQASILFLHIREIDEIERAKKDFGAVTLLVKRKGVEPVQSNESDKNVLNYNYDFVIDNDSDLNSLRIKVKDFYHSLINSKETISSVSQMHFNEIDSVYQKLVDNYNNNVPVMFDGAEIDAFIRLARAKDADEDISFLAARMDSFYQQFVNCSNPHGFDQFEEDRLTVGHLIDTVIKQKGDNI